MAIYGIGAFYDGITDVSKEFIEKGIVCIGWSEDDAPTLHEILRSLKIGDIVYIKSTPIGRGLIVKGVGIIIDDIRIEDQTLGNGLSVKWLWQGNKNLGHFNDKYNVRNNTIYEEHNKNIKLHVINMIINTL